MTGAVLKTVVAGYPGQAGSIPVRLRQLVRRPRGVHRIDVPRMARPLPDDPRRRTPRTDVVLADPRSRPPLERLGRAARQGRRRRGARASAARGRVDPEDVVDGVLARPARGRPRRCAAVVNATGVVVHTNLGRAPLSRRRGRGACVTAAGATDVELDLATGRRGRRGRGALAALAAAVPDAEAVHVVNNGAAALPWCLRAGARAARSSWRAASWSRSATASASPSCWSPSARGCARSAPPTGCASADYEGAVGDETAFVLKVHPSNFRVEGFTSSVPVGGLGGRSACPWSPTSAPACSPPTRGCPTSPTRPRRLRAGAALVTASGDKLLGGPAVRPAAGRAALVERLRRHPARPGAARRQAHPGRARGDADRPRAAGRRGPRPAARRTCCARARRIAARLGPDGGGRRARRARSAAAAPPASCCPSAAVALPAAARRRRCASASHPVVGHVADGRLLLDLLAVPGRPGRPLCRRRTPRLADADRADRLTCTSSPPPGTSTTASPRWSGR